MPWFWLPTSSIEAASICIFICSLTFVTGVRWLIRTSFRNSRPAAVPRNSREGGTGSLSPIKTSTSDECTEWFSHMVALLWANAVQPHALRNLREMLQSVGVEVSEASLGTAAPKIGLGGTFWATSPHGQEELHATFEWMSESLCVQVSLPHSQAGRQVAVDQCRIEGRLKILPVLDRGALLWAFDTPPDVCLSLTGTGEATAEGRSWAERVLLEALVGPTANHPRYHLLLPPSTHNEDPLPLVGTLSVGIKSCSGLGGLGGGQGAAHLFVEVGCGKIRRQSEGRGGERMGGAGGRRWRWQEEIRVQVEGGGGEVEVGVYERRDGGECRRVGGAEVQFKCLPRGSTLFWAAGVGCRPLAAHSAGPTHKVGLTLQLLPHPSEAEVEVDVCMRWGWSNTPKFEILQPPLPTLTGQTLTVALVDGRDLCGRGGEKAKNPYVRIVYGSHSRRSKGGGDWNPVWNQQFRFKEVGGGVGGGMLSLECWDASFPRHRKLGVARVMTQVLAKGGAHDMSLQLEGAASGEIRIRCQLGRGAVEAQPERLEMTVLEARGLCQGDTPPDAYVSLQTALGKQKSRVVHKSSEPKWDTVMEVDGGEGPLTLKVKTLRKIIGGGTQIGTCHLDLQDWTGDSAPRWVQLAGGSGGEIRIMIRPKPSDDSSSSPPKSARESLSSLTATVREVLEKAQSMAEQGDSFHDVGDLIERLQREEDEREEQICLLLKDRGLLLRKVKQLEDAMKQML